MFADAIRNTIQAGSLAVALVAFGVLVSIARHNRLNGIAWPLIIAPALIIVHTIIFYSAVTRCNLMACVGVPERLFGDWSSVLRFHSIGTILVLLLEVHRYGLPHS